MKRRDFLRNFLMAGVGAAAGELAWPRDLPAAQSHRHRKRRASQPQPSPKLQRVGISTWSFHDYFQTEPGKEASPDRRLVLLDFPEMIADRYKVHNLEFVAPHFASTEPAYLQELKNKMTTAHSRLINIPVDIPEIQEGGGLSAPDLAARQSAIEGAKKWIDIAKILGARSVRCDPGNMDVDDLTLTLQSYKTLAAYGKSKGIYVLIENHGPIGSEHPEALVRLFKAVGSPFLGALPDFGNFPDEDTRLRGLPMLFPYAKTDCHAKGLEFDAAGNETQFDFAKCVEISKQARYKGIYSIEYEGGGDPYDGVQKVVTELAQYL